MSVCGFKIGLSCSVVSFHIVNKIIILNVSVFRLEIGLSCNCHTLCASFHIVDRIGLSYSVCPFADSKFNRHTQSVSLQIGNRIGMLSCQLSYCK